MSSAVPATIASLARHSAVRFLIVGGLSFIADAGSLFLFHGVLGIWLPLATVLAFGVAFVVNFGVNRIWAFRTTNAIGSQIWKYFLLVLANLAVTVLLVQGLTTAGLPYLIAKVLTTIALSVVNYLLSKKFIFV